MVLSENWYQMIPKTTHTATLLELLISLGEKRLQNVFTNEEFLAMCNVCSSMDWTPAIALRSGVLINVEDADETELLDINKNKLIEKLSALQPLEQFALVDKKIIIR